MIYSFGICFHLLQVIFGVLQFGFITIFLSDALVSGYTTGAAVHVFSSQLRHIVGLSSSDVMVEPGLFALPRVSSMMYVLYVSVLVVRPSSRK